MGSGERKGILCDNLGGMMNKKTRLKVYEKYGGHCAYCGEAIEFKEMQVDHIKPLCRGNDC